MLRGEKCLESIGNTGDSADNSSQGTIGSSSSAVTKYDSQDSDTLALMEPDNQEKENIEKPLKDSLKTEENWTHYVDQQKFICSVCGISFAWKSTMNKHMTTIHSDYPLPKLSCETCGKQYSTATQVQGFASVGFAGAAGVYHLVELPAIRTRLCVRPFLVDRALRLLSSGPRIPSLCLALLSLIAVSSPGQFGVQPKSQVLNTVRPSDLFSELSEFFQGSVQDRTDDLSHMRNVHRV
uniref:C2H2-type domain-containing protein n=1 Tax=Timema shepardi TaxID=629360 RepID=A0A7R9B1W4_TIMSH|nr:unnamed protein product [Timema shepardi]